MGSQILDKSNPSRQTICHQAKTIYHKGLALKNMFWMTDKSHSLY